MDSEAGNDAGAQQESTANLLQSSPRPSPAPSRKASIPLARRWRITRRQLLLLALGAGLLACVVAASLLLTTGSSIDGQEDSPPDEPDGGESAGCSGVYCCGSCYRTLEAAAAALPCPETALPTLVIKSDLAVAAPVTLRQSAVIASDLTGTRRKIVAGFGSGALLSLAPTGDQPLSLTLADLDFAAQDGQQRVSAIRCEMPQAAVSLRAERVSFSGFRSADGVNGAAVHLARVAELTIQDGSFVNNVAGEPGKGCEHKGGPKSEFCRDRCTPVYGGGGAMFLGDVEGPVMIEGSFQSNSVLFNHGQGGAIYIERLASKATITGTFKDNVATEGAVVEVVLLTKSGELLMSGVYEGNTASDPFDVCGTRGGVIMLREVHGSVSMAGQYRRNRADKHAGVLRNDRLMDGGRIEMLGEYTENAAPVGCVAQLVTLFTGSRFSFKPGTLDEGRCEGQTVVVTRSTDCPKKGAAPAVDIEGCTRS